MLDLLCDAWKYVGVYSNFSVLPETKESDIYFQWYNWFKIPVEEMTEKLDSANSSLWRLKSVYISLYILVLQRIFTLSL